MEHYNFMELDVVGPKALADDTLKRQGLVDNLELHDSGDTREQKTVDEQEELLAHKRVC